ncbi:MAG TPA: phosphatase PAP2 family protein [Actinomycetales bacterium]|nr:phosphatase PAP2 family protein [Actinomycetales bacterium]
MSRRRTASSGLLYAGVPAALWYGVLVGVGVLIGGPLFATVAGAEDGMVPALADARTPVWDGISHAVSTTADTLVIVGTAAALGLLLRWVLGRWLESVVLWAGVALQSTIFLLTTLVVSRPRPDVDKLDPAPPTSSFPSGHTGASTALYVGLALVIAGRIRRRRLRLLVVAALALVPLAVGLARLYRGMHHPSDVVFGALNGVAALVIVRFATFHGLESGAPATAVCPHRQHPQGRHG